MSSAGVEPTASEVSARRSDLLSYDDQLSYDDPKSYDESCCPEATGSIERAPYRVRTGGLPRDRRTL